MKQALGFIAGLDPTNAASVVLELAFAIQEKYGQMQDNKEACATLKTEVDLIAQIVTSLQQKNRTEACHQTLLELSSCLQGCLTLIEKIANRKTRLQKAQAFFKAADEQSLIDGFSTQLYRMHSILNLALTAETAETTQELKVLIQKQTQELPRIQTENENLRQQLIVQMFLEECGALVHKQALKPKVIFVSYALADEGTPEAQTFNARLNGWLIRLGRDLSKVGIHLLLDKQKVADEKDAIVKCINKSHYVFVIGTPDYVLQVRRGSGVVFQEWEAIQQRVENSAEGQSFLVPLCYAGEPQNTFPVGLELASMQDFREFSEYANCLLRFEGSPLGLIPQCYSELNTGAGYGLLVKRFERQAKQLLSGGSLSPRSLVASELLYLPSAEYIDTLLQEDGFDPAAENKRGEQSYMALDFQAAVESFEKAAKTGNREAQYNLGICYYYGYGIPQNYTQAVHYYRLAGEQGHVDAQNNLGNCYYKGKGSVAKDMTQAKKWFAGAAHDYPAAQFNLGVCYQEEKNYAKALFCYRLAAEQGHAGAQLSLGVLYEKGWGAIKDEAEALKWYQQAALQNDGFQINGKDAKARVVQLHERARAEGKAFSTIKTQPVLKKPHTQNLESLQDLIEKLELAQAFLAQQPATSVVLGEPSNDASYTPSLDYRQSQSAMANAVAFTTSSEPPGYLPVIDYQKRPAS